MEDSDSDPSRASELWEALGHAGQPVRSWRDPTIPVFVPSPELRDILATEELGEFPLQARREPLRGAGFWASVASDVPHAHGSSAGPGGFPHRAAVRDAGFHGAGVQGASQILGGLFLQQDRCLTDDVTVPLLTRRPTGTSASAIRSRVA